MPLPTMIEKNSILYILQGGFRKNFVATVKGNYSQMAFLLYVEDHKNYAYKIKLFLGICILEQSLRMLTQQCKNYNVCYLVKDYQVSLFCITTLKIKT